jgi:hypothetical protein
MPVVYFSKLPLNVARSAFRDAISKLLQDTTGNVVDGQQPFTIDLPIPDKPTAELKHLNGAGSVNFLDDDLLLEFLAKVRLSNSVVNPVD